MKVRVADKEVYCPREAFDYRISVSLELDYPHSLDGLAETNGNGDLNIRSKDRLSYKHQCMSIDLTQVTTPGAGEKSHELEIEMDTNLIVEQGKRMQAGAPNNYEELVEIFLNYIRVVNRAGSLSGRK